MRKSIKTRHGHACYHVLVTIVGVTSYLPVCAATQADVEAGRYPMIELTYEQLDWDPQDPRFCEQEEALVDWNGQLLARDHVTAVPIILFPP